MNKDRDNLIRASINFFSEQGNTSSVIDQLAESEGRPEEIKRVLADTLRNRARKYDQTAKDVETSWGHKLNSAKLERNRAQALHRLADIIEKL